jgi:cell division protein FtsA
MEINSPTLFIEINNSEYIFTAGDMVEDNFQLIYKHISPIRGIENLRIIDFDLVLEDIKKNIYLIEQKLNFIFKETILIINNFDRSFINLSGFKKLNGSQLLKENIIYILNSLKSKIDQIENKKTILHIFNSKYLLDKKKVENLPIGLFGNFYSHELSFCVLNNNDYSNLIKIFDNCNLKIKKILFKSFVEGSIISNENTDLNTFFQIKINENNSQIFFFEDDSLKFEQNFNFGLDLILRDISRITSLKKDIIKNIINNIEPTKNIVKDELVEKELFENQNYIKIKKKLILEIAEARIEEYLEIMLIKNINFASYNKKDKIIFFVISNKSHLRCFKSLFQYFFSNNNNLNFKLKESIATEDLMNSTSQLVQYGWKKEAIPIAPIRKSVIARLFEVLFN